MRKTSGISLMLLIFLSLCLITFSLLSLSGAVADESLSQKAADRTSEYYAADSAADEMLAQIDQVLAEHLRESQSSADPGQSYLDLCANLEQEIPGVTLEDAQTLSFVQQVNETQVLQVTLSLTYPYEEDDTLYQILSWKVETTREWNADTAEPVLRKEDIKEELS